MTFSELMNKYKETNNHTFDSMANIFRTTKTTIANWCKGYTTPDIKPDSVRLIAKKLKLSEEIVIQSILRQNGLKVSVTNGSDVANVKISTDNILKAFEGIDEPEYRSLKDLIEYQIKQNEYKKEHERSAYELNLKETQRCMRDIVQESNALIYLCSLISRMIDAKAISDTVLNISLTEKSWELGTSIVENKDGEKIPATYIDTHYELIAPEKLSGAEIIYLFCCAHSNEVINESFRYRKNEYDIELSPNEKYLFTANSGFIESYFSSIIHKENNRVGQAVYDAVHREYQYIVRDGNWFNEYNYPKKIFKEIHYETDKMICALISAIYSLLNSINRNLYEIGEIEEKTKDNKWRYEKKDDFSIVFKYYFNEENLRLIDTCKNVLFLHASKRGVETIDSNVSPKECLTDIDNMVDKIRENKAQYEADEQSKSNGDTLNQTEEDNDEICGLA